MNKQLTVVFSIAILLTVTVVASIDLIQTADAIKAKGTTTQKYGSDTKSQVCGDRLCSEIPTEERMNKKMNSSQEEMKVTHKKTKQKHLDMFEDMKSMTKSEMIDSMKSAMSKHQDMMIEKLNQMDRQEILDHMSMMTNHMNKMDSKSMDNMNDKMDKYMDMKKIHGKMSPLYNDVLNPSQTEYPNIVGFNDLHIEAIRHLAPNGDDSKLEVIVHHHCKVYDDMTASCLLFPTGMNDQDKPYGIEYIITSDQFQELSEDEKKYWHYHLTELPRAQAAFPDLTDEELVPLQPVVDETYGKVFYFWDTDDKYPIGEPTVLVIQDLPE